MQEVCTAAINYIDTCPVQHSSIAYMQYIQCMQCMYVLGGKGGFMGGLELTSRERVRCMPWLMISAYNVCSVCICVCGVGGGGQGLGLTSREAVRCMPWLMISASSARAFLVPDIMYLQSIENTLLLNGIYDREGLYMHTYNIDVCTVQHHEALMSPLKFESPMIGQMHSVYMK